MDFNADLFSVDRPVAPQPVSAGHMVQALERPLPLGAKIISVGKDNGSAPAPWTGPRAVGVVVSRFRVEQIHGCIACISSRLVFGFTSAKRAN